MKRVSEHLKDVPVAGKFAWKLYQRWRGKRYKNSDFSGSGNYWEQRYASGGNSGVGSYDKFARFKADFLNAFVERNKVTSVIEFGCGDGNQLSLANYQAYLGLDVSETAIATCSRRFAGDGNKVFSLIQSYQGEKAELALSLDVIYHLVEDEVFEGYMRKLFAAGTRYVIIYSSDTDINDGKVKHVKHRQFTRWVEAMLPNWNLLEHIPNKYPYQGDYKTGSFADFYVYEKCKR